jgi:hypothetical protein
MSRVTKTYDDLLELKDAGLVAASAAATVSSAAKVIDLGAGDVEGDIIIDVSACEVASGNEIYTIGVQISSSASFASDIYEIVSLQLGDAAVIPGDVDMGVGRYVLPFQNRIANGVAKRYLRLYTTVGGTIATGINYTAYLARK